jgi:hypothetical protein
MIPLESENDIKFNLHSANLSTQSVSIFAQGSVWIRENEMTPDSRNHPRRGILRYNIEHDSSYVHRLECEGVDSYPLLRGLGMKAAPVPLGDTAMPHSYVEEGLHAAPLLPHIR